MTPITKQLTDSRSLNTGCRLATDALSALRLRHAVQGVARPRHWGDHKRLAWDIETSAWAKRQRRVLRANVVTIAVLNYTLLPEVTIMPDEPQLIPDAAVEFTALQSVISALQPLSVEARQRIVDAAVTFLRLSGTRSQGVPQLTGGGSQSTSRAPSYSADTSMSPKEFLLEKQPLTDVERMACLAYYLTHYRDTPHFKTLDLSKLNTEAAQPKFANAANTSNNAVKRGYLVQSSKGQRQLSAAGERFVFALPDRSAAKSAMSAIRPRRRTSRQKPGGNSDIEDSE
jgi:hypothetical protein